MRNFVLVAILLLAAAAGYAQSQSSALKSYPLPPGAQHAMEELAATSDVLILGEVHGTQEVPQLAATLLAPLTKLGYQVLALEVPGDQQASITAWATGKTDVVPNFYAKPWTDGRGNEQTLSLIRMALSPPYRWKLVCFDQSEADSQQQDEQLKQKIGPEILKNSPASLSLGVVPDWMIADWQQRDAAMASNFGSQLQQIGPQAKVLAICGDLHARTANHPDTGIPMNNLFWPSFAAVLQSSHPTWRVSSIDVRPQSGGFFNGGKVNPVTFGGKPIDDLKAQPLEHGDWNLALDMPLATPATFLITPVDPDEPSSTTGAANGTSDTMPENEHP